MIRTAFNRSSVFLAPRLGNVMTQRTCLMPPTDVERTTARVLNQEIDAGLMIDSISQNGFRLNNGMTVFGPVAMFPKTVLSWRVQSAEDITEDSLSLFCLLEPKIDILVIGIGDKDSKVNPRVIQYMRKKGISLEVLPTESACTTFNFLNEEKRYVAAALIPPINMRSSNEDMVQSQVNRNQLFKTQEDEIF